MNPFDYLTTINDTKKNLMRGSENDELSEKDYNAFLINRGLSYFQDTISLANEMNYRSHLDKKMQYEFLLNLVRKRKRFSKWFKKEEDSKLEVIKEYYSCNHQRAKEYLSILTDEQFIELEKRLTKGGN